MEPDLNKTGYLIPLVCGHNGQLSINEKTIYEIHLTNAGFIQEQNAPVSLNSEVWLSFYLICSKFIVVWFL